MQRSIQKRLADRRQPKLSSGLLCSDVFMIFWSSLLSCFFLLCRVMFLFIVFMFPFILSASCSSSLFVVLSSAFLYSVHCILLFSDNIHLCYPLLHRMWELQWIWLQLYYDNTCIYIYIHIVLPHPARKWRKVSRQFEGSFGLLNPVGVGRARTDPCHRGCVWIVRVICIVFCLYLE